MLSCWLYALSISLTALAVALLYAFAFTHMYLDFRIVFFLLFLADHLLVAIHSISSSIYGPLHGKLREVTPPPPPQPDSLQHFSSAALMHLFFPH